MIIVYYKDAELMFTTKMTEQLQCLQFYDMLPLSLTFICN